MKQTVSYVLLIALVTTCVILSIAAPWTLDDQNAFLKGFVTHELLAFLGVLVTITLASAAQLHLALNGLEESANARHIAHHGFAGTRRAIRSSAMWLLWLLPLSLVVVVTKPLVVAGGGRPVAEALFNSLAIILVFIGILLLIDITKMVLLLTPTPPKGPGQ